MKDIFKPYDIRGIYPDQINEQVAEKVGMAFYNFLKTNTKNEKTGLPLKIVIGEDNRKSSSFLKRKIIKGIKKQGGDVVDIGLSTTPMFYFATTYHNIDGGMMITASHNPPEYNGFKVVKRNAVCIGKDNGLIEIEKIAEEKQFSQTQKKGKLIKKDVLEDYVRFNLEQFDLNKIKPLRVVIDTGNAVTGIIMPELFKHTNLEIIHIFSELDGNFPNHNPNPLNEKNLAHLKETVRINNADLGIAFDGDGDRVFFVDEKAETIPSDFIICLISKILLKENPQSKILYNVYSSRIVKEIIEKYNGTPTLWKTGHTFIKNKMMEEEINFAGEFSGHYYMMQQGKFEKSYYEVPFYVIFKILEEISQKQKTISQLISPFKKYFHSGEIKFNAKDKEEKIKKLQNKYKKGKISHLDGLRVEFDDWWFNIRPSGTEDVLKLVVEAGNEKTLKNQIAELDNIISRDNN